VENYPVTVIQGETGSGKTTQVAQYLLDEHARRQRYCNIVVTQPRKIAAISIATHVCRERGWQVGNVCGYQVGGVGGRVWGEWKGREDGGEESGKGRREEGGRRGQVGNVCGYQVGRGGCGERMLWGGRE
jgi:hypothetical protein